MQGNAIFGLVASDPEAGQFGVALASRALAGGGRFLSMRSNAGAVITSRIQRGKEPGRALDLLGANFNAAYVRDGIVASGEEWCSGQLVVADRHGGYAGVEGADAERECGCVAQEGVAAFGAGLADLAALHAISRPRDKTIALDAYLVRELERGSKALKGVAFRSAAVVVFGPLDVSTTDLRVDMHDTPVAELVSLWEEYEHYKAYYRRRSDQPTITESQEDFARELEARLAREKA